MIKPATILVVDDQPAMLDNIQISLEMLGHRVLGARDGLQALSILEAEPVDLILADVAMPGMNGYQLYERVRHNPDWLAIPFVFITARALDSDIRFGKEMGVDDYMTKPFKLEDLQATVQGKLRRRQQLAEWADSPSSSQAPSPDLLVVGALRIHLREHRVWLGDRPIELSAREFVLLRELAQHAGQPLSLSALCQASHGLELTDGEAGSLIYPLLRTLRRKLGYAAGNTGCLEAVRGVGYRLVPPAAPNSPTDQH